MQWNRNSHLAHKVLVLILDSVRKDRIQRNSPVIVVKVGPRSWLGGFRIRFVLRTTIVWKHIVLNSYAIIYHMINPGEQFSWQETNKMFLVQFMFFACGFENF